MEKNGYSYVFHKTAVRFAPGGFPLVFFAKNVDNVDNFVYNSFFPRFRMRIIVEKSSVSPRDSVGRQDVGMKNTGKELCIFL